jgi:hypothetical protein
LRFPLSIRRLSKRFLSLFGRISKELSDTAKFLPGTVAGSRREFGLSWVQAFERYVDLRFRRRIAPRSIFVAALTNPAFNAEHLDRFIGRSTLIKMHDRISPQNGIPLLHDKFLFYRQCALLNIPTLGWNAVFFPKHPGMDCNGRILLGRSAWLEYFTKSLGHTDFVIKEARTDFGTSVRLYRSSAGEFIDLKTGESLAPEGLYRILSRAPADACFVFQNRLRNHSDFEVWGGPSEALQTLRVATFVDLNGDANVHWAILRIVATDEVQDNFNNHDGGYLFGKVEIESGRLESVLYMHEEHFGMQEVTRHPRTGASLVGVQIPD